MKKKIKERFNDHLYFLEICGQPDVICFKKKWQNISINQSINQLIIYLFSKKTIINKYNEI